MFGHRFRGALIGVGRRFLNRIRPDGFMSVAVEQTHGDGLDSLRAHAIKEKAARNLTAGTFRLPIDCPRTYLRSQKCKTKRFQTPTGATGASEIPCEQTLINPL
jgi:hypothetical protein